MCRCLRSMTTLVCSSTAWATSAEVTEPYSLPSTPDLAVMVMILGTSVGGDRLGAFTILGVAQVAGPAHRRRLGDGAVGGDEGVALRQQEVAGVAVGDLDDVAALAKTLAIGAEDDLHAHASTVSSLSTCGHRRRHRPGRPRRRHGCRSWTSRHGRDVSDRRRLRHGRAAGGRRGSATPAWCTAAAPSRGRSSPRWRCHAAAARCCR